MPIIGRALLTARECILFAALLVRDLNHCMSIGSRATTSPPEGD
jgi:hypothetical protein